MDKLKLRNILMFLIIVLLAFTQAGCKKDSGLEPAQIPAGGSQTNSAETPEDTCINSSGKTELSLPSIAGKTGTFAYINRDQLLVIVTPQEQKTVPTNGRVYNFSWSSFGDKVALIVDNKNADKRDLVIYHLQTQQLETVPQFSDQFLAGVLWAPRGRHILLDYGSGGGGREFKIVTPDTWKTVCERGFCYGVDWSPDGTSLVYGSPVKVDPPLPLEGGDSSDLIITGLPDGKDRIIARGTAQDMYFPHAWIPDQTIIYYYYKKSAENVFEPKLWQVKEDGSSPSIVTELPFPYNKDAILNSLPINIKTKFNHYSWSPDKKYLSIWCNNDDLYLLNWDNKSLSFIGNGVNMQWSPQGISST